MAIKTTYWKTDTAGGQESGSNAWKAYLHRAFDIKKFIKGK
jgi:hypothetical protein